MTLRSAAVASNSRASTRSRCVRAQAALAQQLDIRPLVANRSRRRIRRRFESARRNVHRRARRIAERAQQPGHRE
jgi:hypothetical protein